MKGPLLPHDDMVRSGKDFHINFQWLAGKFNSSVSLIMPAGCQ